MQRLCPVCGSEKSSLIFHDHNRREGYSELEWDFVLCDTCHMKYLTNIPSFEEMGDKYSDIYVDPDIAKLRSKLEEDPQKLNKKILDIGCNHATQLIPRYNQWYDVYGIDLNEKAIADCKKYLPEENFQVSTLEDAWFQENFFDRIQTFHVLEHVYEPKVFVNLCHILLKTWGELEIRIPHGRSLEMRIWGKYSSQSWVPFHINMFDTDTMRCILMEAGFTDILIHTNPIPWWWILSYRQYRGTINTKRGVTNFHQNIFHILLQWVLLIPLWVVAQFGYGEELDIVAKK